MSLGYLQGLSFVFFLILGLATILDLVFSEINLSQAVHLAVDNQWPRMQKSLLQAQIKYGN